MCLPWGLRQWIGLACSVLKDSWLPDLGCPKPSYYRTLSALSELPANCDHQSVSARAVSKLILAAVAGDELPAQECVCLACAPFVYASLLQGSPTFHSPQLSSKLRCSDWPEQHIPL